MKTGNGPAGICIWWEEQRRRAARGEAWSCYLQRRHTPWYHMQYMNYDILIHLNYAELTFQIQ